MKKTYLCSDKYIAQDRIAMRIADCYGFLNFISKVGRFSLPKLKSRKEIPLTE